MIMAHHFEANSQSPRQPIFYARHQTFNLIITPALPTTNSAHDSILITPRRHKIYAFTLLALLGLLQVQSAGNTTSTLQAHPVITTAFVFGILAYYLAFKARPCFPLYAAQLNIVMGAFGAFSLASLVTLLVSDYCWWHIKYIFYVVLMWVELHKVLKMLYDKYVRRLIILTIRKLWPRNLPMHFLPLTHVDLIVAN